MPSTFPHACAYDGCSAITRERYCIHHRHEMLKQLRAMPIPVGKNRIYGRQWKERRKAWLSLHPLCVACKDRGVVRPATVVDHITPHKGDGALFHDETNWQSLCKPCHDIKTFKHDINHNAIKAT